MTPKSCTILSRSKLRQLHGSCDPWLLKVPQSDTVTFNITGNEQARFYLSSTDSVVGNKVLRCYLNTSTNAEKITNTLQTSAKIYLQAGVFYYFEILYVDGTR